MTFVELIVIAADYAATLKSVLEKGEAVLKDGVTEIRFNPVKALENAKLYATREDLANIGASPNNPNNWTLLRWADYKAVIEGQSWRITLSEPAKGSYDLDVELTSVNKDEDGTPTIDRATFRWDPTYDSGFQPAPSNLPF